MQKKQTLETLETEVTKKHSRNMKYGEVLARRAAIENEIGDTKTEYQKISDSAGNALRQVRETGLIASRYKQEIQSENERVGLDRDFMEPEQKVRLKAFEQAADDADQFATGLIKNKEKLNSRIYALQSDLANFDLILSTKEVLNYQDDLVTAEKKAGDLAELIVQQEDIIEEAQNNLPLLPENARKREDLLAKIATGDASSASLKTLDQQIEDEHKQYEIKQTEMLEITVPARETIKGLGRRLTTAKSELETIKSKKPLVLSQFMRGEVDRVGEEYVELALRLVEKFEQLVAFDNIMGNSERIRGRGTNNFMIPLLNVKACQDKGHHNHPGQFWVVRSAFAATRIAESQQAELERITNLGIQI